MPKYRPLPDQQLRPAAYLMKQGGRFERRLASPDDRYVAAREVGEPLDACRVRH